MDWSGSERQWTQGKEEIIQNFGEKLKNKPAVSVWKHEQLVENLMEKYGIAPKGKPFDKLFENKIAQSIESLPGNFRSVVLLSDVEHLRYTEIAKTLACPVGTVCSRLHRGRKILQQRLSNYAADNGNLTIKNEDWKRSKRESFK
jgi:hypothetical protein